MMELTLHRIARKATYTIGHLYLNGERFCDTVEDTDRDINRNGIFDNGEKKIPSETAIPNGTYKITMNVRSPKFSQKKQYDWCKGYLPRLLKVPHFEGILIHAGTTASSSAGCIIVGRNTIKGCVTDSMNVLKALYYKLRAAADNNENITITIK